VGKYTSEPVILYVQALERQKSKQFLGDRLQINGRRYAMGPLSCLSVRLVYCGELVGWFKMPLGTEVGLVQSDIVLDGDPPLPTEWGTAAPTFRPMSIVVKRSSIPS